MQEFYKAIEIGDRAEAWYQIRYNAQTKNPTFDEGIAKRRYYESEIFGLYDTSGTAGGGEAYSVYRMFTKHREAIFKYEAKYGQNPDGTSGSNGNMINQANADYNLSVVSYAAVDTVLQALMPAYETLFADLQAKYPTIMGQWSVSDFNPLNVYLDPLRSVVFLGEATHNAYLDSSLNPLTGQQQNTRDILIGEDGNDILVGSKGDDILIGGKGLDTYIWNTGDGTDTIIDEDKQGVIIINDNASQNLFAAGVFIETSA